MSIKTELKEKLQNTIAKQVEAERELELNAIKMIEEFIIPKFRQIAASRPTLAFLYIQFHNTAGCLCYTSSINDWNSRITSPYDYSVVCKAVELAKNFDIEAINLDNAICKSSIFGLDLNS